MDLRCPKCNSNDLKKVSLALPELSEEGYKRVSTVDGLDVLRREFDVKSLFSGHNTLVLRS
ncbi:MAG TPA: hypothetical protein VKD23_01480 [Terriglobales bacterium]|nr:hypothetical protein [Terriglobales bacterium]